MRRLPQIAARRNARAFTARPCIVLTEPPLATRTGNTHRMVRWRFFYAMVAIGCGVGLAACGSPTATVAKVPVHACSLMSKSEASAIFPTGQNYSLRSTVPVNDQTYCVYPGSTSDVSLVSNVTWQLGEITTFEKAHSGPYEINNGSIPPSTPVTVDGITAYWTPQVPERTSGATLYRSLLAAERNGYVVSLSSTGLSESQNEQVMNTMLRKL